MSVCPGGDLNEESRKTGTETFFSCFPDFLIQKACGFFQDLGTTPRRTGKTEGAGALRLPLCLASLR
jgi:hypothetical protein